LRRHAVAAKETSAMADKRTHGRQDTHDTGSPQARPRDDLRTASKKKKPNESRDEKRDKEDEEQKGKDDASDGNDG